MEVCECVYKVGTEARSIGQGEENARRERRGKKGPGRTLLRNQYLFLPRLSETSHQAISKKMPIRKPDSLAGFKLSAYGARFEFGNGRNREPFERVTDRDPPGSAADRFRRGLPSCTS